MIVLDYAERGRIVVRDAGASAISQSTGRSAYVYGITKNAKDEASLGKLPRISLAVYLEVLDG